MNTKKPYPIFQEPGELTPDTPVMGIPGRIWDAALARNFVANLQRGNAILGQQQKRDRDEAVSAWSTAVDPELFALAVTIFENEKAVRAWMVEPVSDLAQQVPAELCKTPSGRVLVFSYLLRMQTRTQCR